MDMLCINRYYGWYEDTGYVDTIEGRLIYDLTAWHDKFNKSIILTEYGAGSVAGINSVNVHKSMRERTQ